MSFQVWAIAIFRLTANLKEVSSMKLHRDLCITQKSAWFLAFPLRNSWSASQELFSGTVEVDETLMSGLEKNNHQDKKLNAGRGVTGKVAGVGAKSRESNQVSFKIIEDTKRENLHGFVQDRERQVQKSR